MLTCEVLKNYDSTRRESGLRILRNLWGGDMEDSKCRRQAFALVRKAQYSQAKLGEGIRTLVESLKPEA